MGAWVPLLLAGAGLGVAAAAAGGGGGGNNSNTIRDGLVIDGAVAHAVVFRDTDGDGKWLDVNQDGIWEAGDEYITTTDATGKFVGLGGSGLIASMSLENLASNAVANGATLKVYHLDGTVTDGVGTLIGGAKGTITDSNGLIINGVTGNAIDLDSGYAFNGLFIAPGVAVKSATVGSTTTETVYVTGVSTLVSVLLEQRNITNPTQADVIKAANWYLLL
jgi:hypothetical protein